MRVSGPRPLDPDSYDRIACAVCMKIAAPVLLGPAAAATAGASTAATPAAAAGTEGGGAGAAAGGGETAGGAAAAAVEEDLVQCAKCGVRVHRKCYGVPEGVGGPGAGGRMIGDVSSGFRMCGGLAWVTQRDLTVKPFCLFSCLCTAVHELVGSFVRSPFFSRNRWMEVSVWVTLVGGKATKYHAWALRLRVWAT